MMPVTLQQGVAAAALLLIAGLAFWRFRHAHKGLSWLQPVLAGLLYVAVFPPLQLSPGETLVLFTAGATPSQLARHQAAPLRLRLPEAQPATGVAVVPDLATALRQHPAVTALTVVGAGLPARDRATARGWPLRFDAAPAGRGLIEWWPPTAVTTGLRWPLSGRVAQVPGGTVELLDPGNRRIDHQRLSAQGDFTVHGWASGPGPVLFRLRLRDDKGAMVDDIAVPVVVTAGAPLRVVLLSGGPDPELKYLRRWALDAGLGLQSRISLGAGVQIGTVPREARALAELLANQDVLVLDERAWRELGAFQHSVLKAAVQGGLGLLLRINGPLSPQERAHMQKTWGFTLAPTGLPRLTTLAEAGATSVAVSRQAIIARASDGVIGLRDRNGQPLSVWRAEGRGRVGLWWLSDSWRLVLAGHAEAHGRIWSEALAALARRRAVSPPVLVEPDPRVNQRAVLCGLAESARVLTPSGAAIELLPASPVPQMSTCAAFWPTEPGWQVIAQGDQRNPVYVRQPDELGGVYAERDAGQTRQLAATADERGPPPATAGPRWPWLLAWLLVAALSWWLERKTPPSFEGGV